MDTASTRPTIQAPEELRPLLDRVCAAFRPVEVWLFGSRARGDHRPDSDWDLLAVLPDGASSDLTSPLLAWQVATASEMSATILATTKGELDALWGKPNTLGYDLSREGLKLVVG